MVTECTNPVDWLIPFPGSELRILANSPPGFDMAEYGWAHCGMTNKPYYMAMCDKCARMGGYVW